MLLLTRRVLERLQWSDAELDDLVDARPRHSVESGELGVRRAREWKELGEEEREGVGVGVRPTRREQRPRTVTYARENVSTESGGCRPPRLAAVSVVLTGLGEEGDREEREE